MNSVRRRGARAKDGAEQTAVVNALRRIVRALRLSSREAEETLGVSGAQLFVLQQLGEHPSVSLGELAALTLTDQSSVSVVVRRLVARRLVVRKTAASDARRAELSLSAAGRALLARAPNLAHAQLVASLSGVEAAQLRITARVLDEVARAMGGGTGSPTMFFEGEGAPPGKAKPRARAPRRAAR